jgi:hypothetical protein
MEITPGLAPAYRDYFAEIYNQVAFKQDKLGPMHYDLIREVYDLELGDVWSNFTKFAMDLGALYVDVKYYLQNLYYQIYDFIFRIPSHIADLAGRLWTGIQSAMQYVWNIAQPVLSNLVTTLWDAILKVCDAIKNIYDKIATFLSGVWDQVKLYSTLAWNTLKDWLTPVWDVIKNVFSGIWTTITNIFNTVYQFITSNIPSFFTAIMEVIRHAINPFVALLTDFAAVFSPQIKDFMKYFYDEIFIKYLAGATEKLAAVLGYVNGVINDVWSKTIANVFKNKNLSPEDTPAIAIDFILSATAAGVAAHLTSTVAEIWHPTHMIGLHYISGILGELSSYSRIAAASVGVIVAIALRKPFEYYVNSLVRPTVPNERDLAELVMKRELKIDEYEKNMTYHGYSQRWIDCFKRAVFKEPRLTELSYVYEEGSIDDKWLLERIRRYGFSDDDADVFLKSMTTRVTKTQRLDFYNATMDLYSYGFISESQFKDNLDTLDLRKEGKELAAKAATLKYLNAMIKEQITMYVSQYSKDILTAEQLRTALIGLGIDFMKVDVTVNKAVTAKTPKPTQDVSIKIDNEYQKLQQKLIPLYLQQYRLELINEEVLRSSLIAAGAVPSYVDLVISVEKAKKVKTATKTSDVAIATVEKQIDNNYKTAYVQQFRDDYITADQLTTYLVQLGLDADLAESIVAAESAKKYVAPSVTAEGTTQAINKELINKYYDLYVLQYRKDLIDETQLESDLLAIGFDPQDVSVIIQTEYTRKQNPPKESTTALIPAVAT